MIMRRTALGIAIAAALFAGSAAAQTDQPTIRQRQRRQQARIAQGVKSGQLTPHETAKLERKEAALNREVRRDRLSGGGLSTAERAKINRQQNRLSRQIDRQKHDAQHVPPAK